MDPTLGEGKDERLSLKYHAAAGAMAGWTCSLVMTPMEHLKAKLQMQITGPPRYSGPIDAARQVAAASKWGYLGLWHGLGATMLFRTWIGGLFWFYEVQLRTFRSLPDTSPLKPSPGAATFIAGGFGSTFFWLLSLPFDAVKNRLMADSPTNPRYPTWRSAARQIYTEGGPRVRPYNPRELIVR
jgi:solute carrier family 25 carnitine/acylcarnitine transporter 20/29